MSDKEGGKWLPYNLDGSIHDCGNQSKIKAQEDDVVTNRQVTEQMSIEARLARLEEAVFGDKE